MRPLASPKKQPKPAHGCNPPKGSSSIPIRGTGTAMHTAPTPQTCVPSAHQALPSHRCAKCDQSDSCCAAHLNPSAVFGGESLISGNDCTSWHNPRFTLLDREMMVSGQVASEFSDVLTMIDRDEYGEHKVDRLCMQLLSQSFTRAATAADTPEKKKNIWGPPSRQTTGACSVMRSYLAKVDLYANSKLPPDLPAMRLYIPTYPLLSLAARYSADVYQKPQGAERSQCIDADRCAGTKAMVIKSVPMDSSNTIVFAIRGTAHFMDWGVNLKTTPASPAGFLDDLENLCHDGFLSTARKMTAPVAERLRQLLEEDCGRVSYSLLITGHSAGGAVAALLYLHMISVSSQAASELNLIAGCFRRIHCITFGTPPIAILPLKKPDRRGLENSLFLSFVNEGDPVARADKAYVKSLVRLFTSSPLERPISAQMQTPPTAPELHEARKLFARPICQRESASRYHSGKNTNAKHTHGHKKVVDASDLLKPTWHLPQTTFSNAGRLVVLRSGNADALLTSKKTVEERLDEGVVAQFATDEQLRGVVWGDPLSHAMKLYAGRIEILAVGAVMVKTCV